MFQKKIIENLSTIKQQVFVCINENQWQHHFEADNYTNIKKIPKCELQDMILEKQFIKLAMKFPLQTWNDVPSLLDDSFNQLITILKISCPGGETDL